MYAVWNAIWLPRTPAPATVTFLMSMAVSHPFCV
jgi:hypothetical protein